MYRCFQQYYKGVKVENAVYMPHGKGDSIEIINGDFQVVNIPSVAPVLNEQQALKYALGFVNAKEHKWQDPGNKNLYSLLKIPLMLPISLM